MNALEAVDVCHSYGKGGASCDVLRNFSLTIAPGEFVALMGPSGSGKSTFLHLAAGLITPTSGRILVGGEEVTAMSDGKATRFRRSHEGVVFQSFNLIDSLSVAENIVLPSKLDHRSPDRERLRELVAKLGLEGCESRRTLELSGGERQRVAIARALFHKPDIVLADEPTGNLDVKNSRSICELLHNLNQTEKSAILLVTHDPVVASAATRVVFLKDGHIAAESATNGDPTEISRLYLEHC